MSEVRSTSSTGGEKGVKAERYDLLPKEGLDAIARVFGFGAEKYADHNWRKGYEWGKSYAALQRHLTAFWSGETLDPESGLPHLAHAGFHILVLLTWLEQDGEGSEFDDRYGVERQEARAALDKLGMGKLAGFGFTHSDPRPPGAVFEALAAQDMINNHYQQGVELH